MAGKGKVPGGHSLPKKPNTLTTATRGNAKPKNDATPPKSPSQPSIFGRRG
jgi:hypothetical protein